MFSDESGDEFSFGIDRLLAEGVYAAAYPLHDVSKILRFFCSIGLPVCVKKYVNMMCRKGFVFPRPGPRLAAGVQATLPTPIGRFI